MPATQTPRPASIEWKAVRPSRGIVVFSCRSCGKPHTWGNDDDSTRGTIDTIPDCITCQQPMSFYGICTRE